MIIQVCVNVNTMKKPLNERFQQLAGIKPLVKEATEGEELDVLGTDNRDISTTKLILSNGSYVIVDPIELMENALENTDNADLMKQFNAFKIGL